MTLMLLFLGLLLLLVGGTALVSGASSLATRLGISPLVVGLTVVAFGTSAPELVVNIIAVLRHETDLAFGNVVGSNLANLGLVLGTAALISPVLIEGQLVRRELPLLMLATCVLAVLTLDAGLTEGVPALSRGDAMILLLLFCLFMYFSIGDYRHDDHDALIENIREIEGTLPAGLQGSRGVDIAAIVGGIVGLTVGGHLTIVNGSSLAESLGVSPVIIGLLVVAIGTSLPELVTSVIAAMRNEADLCVGNVVGSNLFNSLFVLPISALIRPLPIPEGVPLDIGMSLFLAALVVLIFLFSRARMSRTIGGMFIMTYVVYMIYRTLS